MRALLPLSLRVALALAVPAALAGCAGETSTSSGGASSGDADDDDDDDGSTPDPDPDPDPDPEPDPPGASCSIAWYAQGSAQDKMHLYIVDMPVEEWTSGQKEYGDRIQGIFVYDADEQGNAVDEAYATGGRFVLTVSGAAPGDSVAFDDSDEQSYDGAQPDIAQDGRGSFDGVLSDVAAEQWEVGSGDITVQYDGNPVTLGEPDAGCLDEPATSPFAPAATVDRVLTRLRQGA